jgi:hypothetical protein
MIGERRVFDDARDSVGRCRTLGDLDRRGFLPARFLAGRFLAGGFLYYGLLRRFLRGALAARVRSFA